MLFIVMGMVMGAAIIAYGVMGMRREEETLEVRLGRYDLKQASSLTALELQLPRRERIFRPLQIRIARVVRRMTPAGTIEKTQMRLAQAGHPGNMTVQDFLGIKGIVCIATCILSVFLLQFLFHTGTVVFVLGLIIAVVLGFMLPDLWLSRKIKDRQKEIQKFMADAIDILAISVAAGQGFDGALETLSKRKQNALTAEFDRFRMEVQAGKGRRDAFRDLALRTGVEDLSIFVAALIQADQLGIGIAQVLRAQSEELRIKRRQRAEETARQAPIKMLFPLILLMFPALFIVILGPAIPSLMYISHS